MDDSLVRATTTATSLDVEQDRGVNTSRSGEDSLKLNELMEICTTLQLMVLALENTKTTQALEIKSLKRKVKKLKRRKRSRTYGLKRLYKVGLSARLESSKDEGLEVVADKETIDEITLAKALEDLKTSKPKIRGIVIKDHEEPSESITTPIISSQQPSQLQAEEEEEEEERVSREKAQQVEEVNIAWDDVQAKIDVDYELAQRLQAEEQEELIDVEKEKLFMEFLKKKRKFFTAKRDKEKRNRPPTKVQQRSLMCTHLKNMDGWKLRSLKNKSFVEIQELFDKEMRRINTFVDYKIELVMESSKKAQAEVRANAATQNLVLFRSNNASSLPYVIGAASRWLRNEPAGCVSCNEPYYTKDCPLKEEGKTFKEAYYTQFGVPFPQGGRYRVAAVGFYQRDNGNPLYQEQRQTMEESLSKFMAEPAKRHDDNSNLIKESQAKMDAAIINQGSLIKALEIQIEQMSKDIKVPLILGRPFLFTTHAKIDVFKRKITLKVGDDKIVFKSDKPTSNIIKRVYALGLREQMELDLEARIIGEALILNISLDHVYRNYIKLNDLNEPLKLRRNQVEDLGLTIKDGEVINKPMIEINKTKNDDEEIEGINEYPSLYDFDRKICIDCAYNLQFSCMIDFEHVNANGFMSKH
nr:hypothetical protein [Tanacetum cinerariifolium]